MEPVDRNQAMSLLQATMSPKQAFVAEINVSTSIPEPYFWELQAARFLYAGPCTIIWILGTVFNTLSFLVFNRPSLRHSVTSFYFRVLAISDSLVLWSGGIFFFPIGAFDYDIRNSSTIACKFFVPCLLTTCYFSCWNLVFLTVDRFVGVYLPHKYRDYCTHKKVVVSMAVLLIVNIVIVGCYWGTILDIQPDGICGIGEGYLSFFYVYKFLDLCLLNIVPTIILLTVNIAIIVKIVRATRERQTTTGGAKTTGKVSTPTTILLSVSLVYFMCTIPTSTKFLIKSTFGTHAHGMAQALLYDRCCDTFYFFNHGVNFLLYCVHGTAFRNELYKMFRTTPSSPIMSSSSQSSQRTQLSTYQNKSAMY